MVGAAPEAGADVKKFRDGVRRFVAAQCCAFLEGANLEEERWSPYKRWAGELGPSDTIITFNYDRVLELLGGFHVVDFASPKPHPTLPQVLKLHGSVDWRRVEDGAAVRYEVTDDPRFVLRCEDSEIGVATPGPSKKIATKELKNLWDRALHELRAADAIVFVGYRFPPSDAEAREKLLRAIRLNHRRAPHTLNVHIVLGPKRSDDVFRLEGLLRAVLSRGGRTEGRSRKKERVFHLHTHPMFAEDFFTVSSRRALHRSKARDERVDPASPRRGPSRDASHGDG
jgi:hypothetical protein